MYALHVYFSRSVGAVIKLRRSSTCESTEDVVLDLPGLREGYLQRILLAN